MNVAATVVRDRYQDSVRLMRIGEDLRTAPGIQGAGVLMGTQANRDSLRESDLWTSDLETATANDIMVIARGETMRQATAAVSSAVAALDQKQQSERPVFESTDAAIAATDSQGLGLVAVPGAHAAAEARRFLEAGRSVFIFSDNVSIEDERALKSYAHDHGLLVMGPDAGTALLGGIGLGFCNQLPRGRVGIVAASGTGAQAVSTLLAGAGVGVSAIIGLGGRDTSEEVGGVTLFDAIDLLDRDPATDVVILVAKSMGPSVRQRLCALLPTLSKPMVVLVHGWPSAWVTAALGASPAYSFNEAARRAVELLREIGSTSEQARLQPTAPSSQTSEGLVRGLFAGGTLALEADSILRELSEGSTCRIEVTDLGDDVHTAGRPHPMIAPGLVAEEIVKLREDADLGSLIFDVVLGHGSHADPASILASATQTLLVEAPRPIRVAAVVCGTDGDPQGRQATIETLRSVGVAVFDDVAAAATYALGLTSARSETSIVPAIPEPTSVITVGTDWFDAGLEAQGASVLHVDWRPTAGGDDELASILGRLG